MMTRRLVLAAAGGAVALEAGTGVTRGQEAPAAITITRKAAQPTRMAPPENFTGAVLIDGSFRGAGPARVSGATVHFEAGARTAWHTHPLGQTLIVTSGEGWVQREGGPKEVIQSGDVVWIPVGVKHWHGATASSPMTHVAIAEILDGRSADWSEKVSDAQYHA